MKRQFRAETGSIKYGKFEIFQDEEGQWRWHIKAGNGEIIAQGESHSRKADAERALETLIATAKGFSP